MADAVYDDVLVGIPNRKFRGAVPAIRKIAQIRVEQISNISSSDKTSGIWVCLTRRINDLLAMPNIALELTTSGKS